MDTFFTQSQDLSPSPLDVLTHGAILFDIDETLLKVTVDAITHKRFEETLAESHSLPIVIELLSKGFRLCAITGNDLDKFEHRFIAPLRDHLERQGALDAIQRFEVYANGAATHLTFSEDGAAQSDETYNESNRIPVDDHAVIMDVLTAVNERVAENYLERQTIERDYDSNVWHYAFDEEIQRWVAAEGAQRHSIPWIEQRGHRSQITLKPLPSQKHRRNTDGLDIRHLVLDEIKTELRLRLGERFARYSYQVLPGGWSSIDVTRAVSKASAVDHYLSRHELEPEDATYIGNEFFRGGNDQPLLEKFERIRAIAVNQRAEEIPSAPNLDWGGDRGELSAEYHLTEVLQRYAKAVVAARASPQDPPVPVIRALHLNAFDVKIREQRKFYDLLVTPNGPEQFALRRKIICLQDELLREILERRAPTKE